jgi:hypothetical protein
MILAGCRAAPAANHEAEAGSGLRSAGPTSAAAATPTAFLPATSTPFPPARPIAPSGCCVRPWWSGDSRFVYFVDRPDPLAEASILAVPVEGGTPTASDLPLGLYSAAGELIALPGGTEWALARPDGTAGWRLPSGTLTFRVSRGGGQVAWSEGSSLPVQIDRRQRTIWVANVDGTERLPVARFVGGDLLGWTRNDERLLVSGRPADETQTGIWSLDLAGAATLLWAANRPRSLLLSPDGGWLALLLTFTGDLQADGLWILSTSDGTPRHIDGYGSYRWRSEGRLLLLPFEAGASGLSVVEVEAASGRTGTILPAGALPGGVANNEWLPSPDGRWIVYLNAADSTLWLAALP